MDPMGFNMLPQAQYGLEFDPLLPWLYMGDFSTAVSMDAMSMSTMPMPMMSISPVDQLAPQTNAVPPPQKASSKGNQKAPKASQKQQRAPPVPLQKPEKPLTIRAVPSSQYYIPIGKPDYHFKHGIFPIIPSVMLPSNHSKSPFASTSNYSIYTPNVLSTLVLENIPRSSCKIAWIRDWCLSASGALPKQVILGPRRALVEFQRPGDAIQAWASRRLGVDEFGYRIPTDQGGDAQLMAFWYRPDTEQEEGLLELWKHSKKILPEFVSVTAVKNEKVAAKVITDALEKRKPKEKEEGELEDEDEDGDEDRYAAVFDIDITSLSKTWSVTDPKGDFKRVAEGLGFWNKLTNAVNCGVNEDYLLVWEQQEIARIDRARSIAHARLKKSMVCERKRKLEEEDEGGG
jgi:hypothetical protein